MAGFSALARAVRLSAASAVAAGALLAAAGPASAVGPGTFTKITEPSGTTTFQFDGRQPSNNHFTVKGKASSDVTSVDVGCILQRPDGTVAQPLATNVPVNSGTGFSTEAHLSNLISNCRLRAIPTGVDPATDYLGSYTGPILYANGAVYNTAMGTVYGYSAVGGQGDGIAEAQDAAQCGPTVSATVEPPGMNLMGNAAPACAFFLPSGNVTAGSPTGSAIKVDGHNAYLPFSVNRFLNTAPLSLGLPQSKLATKLTRSANGDVTVTESALLERCNPDATYPPTSCTSLVNTGVTFRRTLNLFRDDHQIRVRDELISTDGQAHKINLQYQGKITPPDTGAVGYTFPGGSSTFHKTIPNEVVSGLGTKASTMFVRSDLDAAKDEPEADTLGLTWSRAPQKVLFSGSNANLFAMPYSVNLPAHGTAYFGFAYSKGVETTDAKTLAAIAASEMLNPPTISSPANGAVIKGQTTTVKGSVTLGANGLPTRVLVNGHAAHLTKVSATKETYSASFSESLGKHTITVTAQDLAGNTKSKSISVTNVAP